MFDTDDNEFDIQKTILKKKERKNRNFYVEYDKLTYQVLGISPDQIKSSNPRHSVFEFGDASLINEIFNNKISLHKLKVKHDYETNKKVLYKNIEHRRGEFDYIRGTKRPDNFIQLNCDVISKKITASFDEYNFMNQLTTEKINELHLSQLPEYLNIYCIDKYEPSKLFGTIDLDFKKLFREKEQRFPCFWLPDSAKDIDNIDFIHYNHEIGITVNLELSHDYNSALKPAIVYKQTGNKLQIQSIMGDTKNFQLDNTITFYLYNSNDPSQILDTINLNTNELDNFNLIEVKLKTKKPVKMISNYHYLHIEDANVSSYYQF